MPAGESVGVSIPAIDNRLALHTDFKEQRGERASWRSSGRVGVSGGVGDVEERVVLDHGSGAGGIAHEGPRIGGAAFDNVVADDGAREIVAGIEPEEAIAAGAGVGADVIVGNGEAVVNAHAPEDSTARITDEVIVEECGAGRGFGAEVGDEITRVICGGEVEKIVIHLGGIARPLEGV